MGIIILKAQFKNSILGLIYLFLLSLKDLNIKNLVFKLYHDNTQFFNDNRRVRFQMLFPLHKPIFQGYYAFLVRSLNSSFLFLCLSFYSYKNGLNLGYYLIKLLISIWLFTLQVFRSSFLLFVQPIKNNFFFAHHFLSPGN